MRSFETISAAILIAVSLVGLAAQPVEAKVMMTRTQRCERFEQQLRHALATRHASVKRAAEARGLQKRARRFCATKRQAQGIRDLAIALKLLGVQPVEP